MISGLRATGLAAIWLAACQPGGGADPAVSAAAPDGASEIVRVSEDAPPGAAPDTCWGKETTPAIVETITEQEMAQAAELDSEGHVLSPPVYRTRTHHRIVRAREEQWFRAPCPSEMGPEFVAALQRALAARDLYHGPVRGAMDERTRRAIRRFQKPRGLDSDILSLDTARVLGLSVYVQPPERITAPQG